MLAVSVDMLDVCATVVASAVVKLEDCLQLFCEPEILAADQTW